MKRNFLLLILVCFYSFAVGAQDEPSKMDSLIFFIGKWQGEGAFANGKKIQAKAEFTMTLDSSWIHYQHTDMAPGKYKAASMWGIDGTSGNFIAAVFDNFHGYRIFESGGWINNRLILTAISRSNNNLIFQHFIYEKLSADSFKMTFEVSRDAVNWTLGDWLVFKRL